MEPEEFGSDALVWRESPLSTWGPTAGSVVELDDICAVYYASLNFRDALNAYGKLPLHSRPKGTYLLCFCVFLLQFAQLVILVLSVALISRHC